MFKTDGMYVPLMISDSVTRYKLTQEFIVLCGDVTHVYSTLKGCICHWRLADI